MASEIRTTGTPDGLAGIGTAITNLRQTVDSRKRVTPGDLDSIRVLYNQWITHTHSYLDKDFVAFPNTPPKGSSSTNRDTDPILSAPTDSTSIVAGTTNFKVFSGEVFELVENFNGFVHQHLHELEDLET